MRYPAVVAVRRPQGGSRQAGGVKRIARGKSIRLPASAHRSAFLGHRQNLSDLEPECFSLPADASNT